MPAGETPVGRRILRQRLIVWATALVAGAAVGIVFGFLLQSVWGGVLAGALAALLIGLSVQRWLRDVAVGPAAGPLPQDRPSGAANWPGYIGLGAAGRDSGRG